MTRLQAGNDHGSGTDQPGGRQPPVEKAKGVSSSTRPREWGFGKHEMDDGSERGVEKGSCMYVGDFGGKETSVR
jgi:hypothetical protein